MRRYIDADVAIDKVDCLFRDTERDKGNFMLRGYNHAVADCIAILKNLDVVEVVRCKECALWDRETIRQNSNDVAWWNEAECKKLAERDGWNEIDHFTDADFFCADGENVTE